MKLARLIEIHHGTLGEDTLADNFGDGVLVSKNHIYRKIRLAALKAQFKFSSNPQPDYAALPFAQLEEILASRQIPYVNNVSVIEKLVAKLKDDVVWDDISDGLRKNFVFHEACHAVARTFAGTISVADSSAKAFQVLMEESFANTCEFLAVADAEETAHRIFFELNSYTALFEERHFIKTAVKSCGFECVFKLMWLAYLHSNFLREHFSDKEWRRCLEIAGAASHLPPQLKALKNLSKVAFTLDPRFRLVTTRFHLKLNAISMTTDEILNFDILANVALPKFLESAYQALR